ncbi:MAG TPA: M36 family metallopeptidase [Actinomycetota bacterium]|nr:M36 family metallopeptidase [Actinomycetota bacterium]
MGSLDRTRPGARRLLSSIAAGLLLTTSLIAGAQDSSARQPREPTTSAISRTRATAFLDSRAKGSVGVSRRVLSARLQLGRTLGTLGVVDDDPTTGTLRFLGRLDGFLTGPSDGSASAVALDYVRSHRIAFGLSRSDLRTFRLRRDYVDVGGTHHLAWVQRVGGVEVFPNGLEANVTEDGRLINVSGSPAAGLRAPSAAARLGAEAAIAAARVAGGGAAVRARGDLAERVLFATGRGARLAWKTTTWVGHDLLVTVVDAENGDVLWRTNLTRSDVPGTGQAVDFFPGASVPNGGGVEHQVSFPVVDGTALSGNNAHVGADVNDNGLIGPAEEIAASSGLDWNYPATLNTGSVAQHCSADYPCTWDRLTPFSWEANRNHFGTQLYYLLNAFHDHLLAPPIAFTEAAGNFQVANPSGQGLGGDPVEGHALLGAATNGGLTDGFHRNNAFMSTPPDGAPPFMGMFLFRGFFVSMHSGDDAAIVYHEYTHGLVARLNTFPDGTDANVGFQAGAMHEAWGDWYGLDSLENDGFVVDGPTVGDVVEGEYPTAGPGIRTQPIDCLVGTSSPNCPDLGFGAGPGGYTFGDMGTVIPFPEVHEDGQIWAQTMWQLRDVLGSTVMEGLATRGQELAPNDPSFLDTRNAMIQADLVNNGGANVDALWTVFAQRGMGFFASSPDGSDTSPIEDFSLPPDCSVDPCGTISGTVTDKASGAPLADARVFIGGHSSGFADDLADTTDGGGAFTIDDVPFHLYPELVIDGVGYEQRIRSVDVDGDESVDVKLVRDWAALEGGADLVSFTPPNYASFCGVNADGAFDLSLSSGWPSDAPDSTAGSNKTGPRRAVVELPRRVDVTSFGVASGGTCGDDSDAGVKKFAIQTRKNANADWVTAVTGSVPANGELRTFKATAGRQNVRFVRFIMKTNHGNALFMDVLEVTVRGR